MNIENLKLIAYATVAIFFLVISVSIYNECKAFQIRIKEKAADLESSKVKLNRVYKEIQTLLSKYSIHESDALKAIISGTTNVNILSIKYPQLKADGLFLNASTNWDSLYTKLQESVTDYNYIITEYNTYVTNFPRNIICFLLGYKEKIHAVIK